MRTIGSTLKEIRIARGLDISDIAKKTCISVHFLNDMEEGRFSRIPKVFDRGYLKIYANFLDLDAKPLLAQFDQEKKGSLRP